MDKMTVNMIAGAVLSSLLVLFGTSTFVNILYPRGGTPGHDEAQVAGAAHKEKAGAPETADAGAAATPLPVLLAKANVDAGAGQAKKCAACHTFEKGGPNKVGPNLFGVVGRPVASQEGFAYSPALKAFGGNWDYEKLNCFIHSPKECVAGTKMAFAGVKKDSDRADVIAYLHSVSPEAPLLPTADKADTTPAEKPAAASPSDKAAPAATAPATPAAPAQTPAQTATPSGGDAKPPVEANANQGGTPAPTEPKPTQN